MHCEPDTAPSVTSGSARTATISTSSPPAGSRTSSTTRTPTGVERAPLFDHVTVAVIGGGFGGLCTGARLRQAGIDDLRLVEGGGDVGGAWYWNRYPGAMCDTAAMIYLPLLEETGHVPTKKYVEAPEIHGQAKRIAETFRLYDNALLLDERHAARMGRRRVALGDPHRPRRPVHGPVRRDGHRPAAPSEAARAFLASSRSPGTRSTPAAGTTSTRAATRPERRLDRLGDRRVGIIGTGATAVQCIPHLARAARELYVFQRTPSSVDVRNNHDDRSRRGSRRSVRAGSASG